MVSKVLRGKARRRDQASGFILSGPPWEISEGISDGDPCSFWYDFQHRRPPEADQVFKEVKEGRISMMVDDGQTWWIVLSVAASWA